MKKIKLPKILDQWKEEKQKEIKFKEFEKEIDYLDYVSKQHALRN